MVPFTRRRKLDGIGPLRLQGTVTELQNQVKYLGVILDRSLHWGPHLQKVTQRGKWSLMACRRMVSGTWGLQPKLLHWLYVSVVRPALTYGSLVWWPKMESTIAVKALAGVQRLALIMITGAVSSCPGAALDCLLDMLPIDIYIKVVASKTAQRLRCENLWITSGNNKGHSKIVQVVHNDELDLPSDHMSKKYSFGKPFKVLIPDRKDWSGGKGPIPAGDLECYTDGSKIKNGGTGAGVHWRKEALAFVFQWGCTQLFFKQRSLPFWFVLETILTKISETKQSISILIAKRP
ncbi:uncharacterized protein LOC128999863 [Macrosteles quadrilineatus]|uniref:uncharacterized protein LOC128999863 n=1 Tax=Macrosteles quadrilineatus TaxID=74068 RepID=UPI0023E2505A|nr:uncharacterized protein LOC128999863 [Macrosteles quadrilineatus]